MIWTTQKPTKPGWYWCHMVMWGTGFKKVVEVLQYNGFKFVAGVGPLDEINAQWSSEPISEPKEPA